MTPFLNKGYHFFTDNYYNCVSLTQYLSNHGTYTTGTLRKDRKRNPKKVIGEKVKKGVMIWRSKNGIIVCKRKDKREVLITSHAHNPEMVKVSNRRGKGNMKPNIVRDYNNSMSCIDRGDQMISYHSGLRKTLRSYKKAGVHILEIFLTNAFYLYRKFSPNKEIAHLIDFVEVIIKKVIGKRKKEPTSISMANFQYLAAIPENQQKKKPTRRCRHCATNKIRRELRYQCGHCAEQPALCVDPCFRFYHESLGKTSDIERSEEENNL